MSELRRDLHPKLLLLRRYQQCLLLSLLIMLLLLASQVAQLLSLVQVELPAKLLHIVFLHLPMLIVWAAPLLVARDWHLL